MNEQVIAENDVVQLDEIITDWTPENDMLEVTLEDPREDFLKIIETLTRIGFSKRNEKTLIQSCHILQKKGRFYIMHFKEMFLLDGRTRTNFTVEDMYRRNTIAQLLEDWGLLKIVNPDQMEGFVPTRKIKILSYAEKRDWNLESKYTIGKK